MLIHSLPRLDESHGMQSVDDRSLSYYSDLLFRSVFETLLFTITLHVTSSYFFAFSRGFRYAGMV